MLAAALYPRNIASYLIIFGGTFGSVAQIGLAIGSIATIFLVSAKLAALAPFVFGAALTLVSISSWRGVAQHLANKEWMKAFEAGVLATICTVVTVGATVGLFAGAGIGLTNPHLAPIGFGVAAVSCAVLFSYVAVRFAGLPLLNRVYRHFKNKNVENVVEDGKKDENAPLISKKDESKESACVKPKPPVEIVAIKASVSALISMFGMFNCARTAVVEKLGNNDPAGVRLTSV